MSILGYSTAYFLPQYWANTPLYGEKIIPLLDYILSTDYVNTDKLATSFYSIESKYTNTTDLPKEVIDEIIEESGYGYVRNLLGDDEDSLKLLVYTLVMIHQLKGSRRGIETVLNLLKSSGNDLEISIVGNPFISAMKEASDFSENDYISYSNFNIGIDPFEINFEIKTGDSFVKEQCIASCSNYGFYLGISTTGKLVLSIGEQVLGLRGWQNIEEETRFISQKTLLTDTTYYITLAYSGYDYTVKVSLDGEKYQYYLTIDSTVPIDTFGGVVSLGVDRSEGTSRFPFEGSISLSSFAVSSNNIQVTQWFETLPVGAENTFEVDSEVDLGLVSSDFFVNFATFVERYVYPTLAAFRAKVALKCKITFLPYVRQRVTYISSNVTIPVKEYFMTQEEQLSNGKVEPFEVKKNDSDEYEYMIVQSSEIETTN